MVGTKEDGEKMVEIGSSLREARSRQGLELAEVAAATMIRVSYLEALETERFEALPAGPYGRSFLREYAEFLGLDGDLFTTEYDLHFAASEPEPPGPPPRPSDMLAGWLDDVSLTRAAVVAGAGGDAGIAVWQLEGTGGTHSAKPTPSQETQTNAPSARHSPTTSKRVTSRPQPVLALTASRGKCWLLVRIGSSAGPTVYEQTLRQGNTVRFGLRKPLWIRLGAPWNLDATIGGHSADSELPRHLGDLFATAAGLRPTL